LAESRVVGWLSRSAERWYNGAPSDRQNISNVRAVRVEGPDPAYRGQTRYYTLMGPFPRSYGVEGLPDWIDQWIADNYGEFI
jgi:hypothetical protein